VKILGQVTLAEDFFVLALRDFPRIGWGSQLQNRR
jgi:hypothetical protein